MTRRPQIDDLTRLAVPEQPALSPDGARLVYVLRTADREADRNARSLWWAGAREGEPVRLTRGHADSAPAWSPDGSRIAFLRAQDGPPQLWLLPAGGGEPEQLTSLPFGAGPPVFSPDGSRIAFGAPVDIAAPPAGESRPQRRAHTPVVADRLDYQADGQGWLRTMRNQLHVVDVATGQCRQVTEADWHAGEPAWSPDGRRLAFAATTGDDPDLTYRAPVHVLDVDGGWARPRLVGLADGVAGPVLWTPDGSALLAVGTLGSPVGQAGLLRLPLDGGQPVNLTAALDRNVMPGGPGYPGASPRLTGDGRSVLYCVRDRGCTHLYAVDLDGVGRDGGAPRHVLGTAGQYVSGLSVAGDRAATVLTAGDSFGEVVTLDVAGGEPVVRTAHGAELGDVIPYPRTEREFTISDGTTVAGWLMRDPRTAGPGPLLLDIHGGPHNAWNGAADEAHLYHQELVSRGWTVLLLNPRGSDGYGERFFNAVVGGWGQADAKDFLEPLDALVAEGIADPARLAVAGYSYGGFMTCYLTGHDRRFAAAVAGGVVSDLVSAVGSSDDGHLLAVHELGGTPWARPEQYRAMSPLTLVDQVRTPTLILQGAADVRCPIGQAQQWHTALRERGVPARLVLYPEASHLFILQGPPSQRLDYNRRMAEWLQRYAADTTGPRRPRIDAAHWQRRLAVLAERHGVPGATLGILRVRPGADGTWHDPTDDEQVEAAYGVLNKHTGVPVTTDSVFQIGSMTKVWTATVVMQLVDEGRLDLDTPVVAVLPELRLSDAETAERVTMRHLLTHTSGIDGDVFTDTGRGDDCLETYVAHLEKVAQNHPLGATWSYCNAGFVLAGRVIEKLTGQTWDQAMRERIFTPLGMRHAITLPEEALLHRAAVGHVAEGGAEPQPAPVWCLPRALGPAGLVTASAADALAFARMHLTGGVAADGTRLLRAASAAAMTDQQAELPDRYTLGDSWGLGWIRMGWDGHRLIGHDGNTIGQSAFLRLLPEAGLAVALLTNGGNTRDLYEDLYREIFADVAGVRMPEPLGPAAAGTTVDIGPHTGRYERASVLIEVFERDGTAMLRTTATGPLAELVADPVQEYELLPADGSGDLFVIRSPETRTWVPVTFYSLPTGERYLHTGVRATPKVG